MQSKATSIDQYISELPEDRKIIIKQLVETIRENIPEGFGEGMGYGMPAWFVPHSIYPKGYHCDPRQPVPFLSIASQKNHISFYHMALYEGSLLNWFLEEWSKTSSRKPDLGKSCLRFKKAADIPFELLGRLISRISVTSWIDTYEKNLQR